MCYHNHEARKQAAEHGIDIGKVYAADDAGYYTVPFNGNWDYIEGTFRPTELVFTAWPSEEAKHIVIDGLKFPFGYRSSALPLRDVTWWSKDHVLAA